MMQGPNPDVGVGDVVRLRKPHPCGGYDWTVVRIGADIGLRCSACGRRVLLGRRVFNRRLKTVLEQAPRPPASSDERGPDGE